MTERELLAIRHITAHTATATAKLQRLRVNFLKTSDSMQKFIDKWNAR